METLNILEIEAVAGSRFIEMMGYAFGFVMGKGTRTQQAIDEIGNPMLSAMQYGA